MDRLSWCIRKKKGIRLVTPSKNLCDSYIKKAENSLMSMRLNFKAGISDWAVSAAYYARYHMIYALLMRCGIKSEIHDCSIAVARGLFRDYIPERMLKELELAKVQRINMQYYTDRAVGSNDILENIESAGDFVLSLKAAINKIDTEEMIQGIRERLRKFFK